MELAEVARRERVEEVGRRRDPLRRELPKQRLDQQLGGGMPDEIVLGLVAPICRLPGVRQREAAVARDDVELVELDRVQVLAEDVTEAEGQAHSTNAGRPARARSKLVGVQLELRHLWGSPKTWNLDSDEAAMLRGYNAAMAEFDADIDSRAAVLVAAEDTGEIYGAWNRDGVSWLVATIRIEGGFGIWAEIWPALDNGVTGP